MSVTDRIDDARILYSQGRRNGSLLAVLMAVTATARKRFPPNTPSRADPAKPMGDVEAFTTFLHDTLSKMDVPLTPLPSSTPPADFCPRLLSTPLLTSTPHGRSLLITSFTFPASNPPAAITGGNPLNAPFSFIFTIRSQSLLTPLPPGCFVPPVSSTSPSIISPTEFIAAFHRSSCCSSVLSTLLALITFHFCFRSFPIPSTGP